MTMSERVRLREKYDWIVLGTHPGSLLSAGLAAKLGASVLILPLATPMTLRLSERGQYFDPEPNYLLGIGSYSKWNGLVYDGLNQMGVSSADLESFRTWGAGPQVITPESRLVLGSEEILLQELNRELGKTLSRQLGLVPTLKQVETEFLTYWSHLPRRLTPTQKREPKIRQPKTLQDLRRKLAQQKQKPTDFHRSISWISDQTRLSDLAESMGKSDLNEVFSGLLYAISSTTASNPSLFELLHSISLSRTGGSFRGGMSSYRNFLIQLAQNLGVHYLPKADCKRIFIEKNRFSGVQISGTGSMISGGAGVLGCSLSRIQGRVNFTSEVWWKTWLRSRKKSPTPQGWRFSLAFSVHREAVPEKLQSRAVWKEKDAPVLEIEVVDSADYGSPDSESKILYLRTVLPMTAESLDQDYQRLVAGRMIRQAMEILPFLEYHVTKIYPDFRMGERENPNTNSGARSELSKVYGFASLEAIPDNLLCYHGDGLGYTTGIEQLFIASDESYPFLGNLGGTVAALESVARLAHLMGMTGPLGSS